MTIGEFEERIAPMKEKYPFTDKETGIKLLEKSNKTYYIDDINYLSIGAHCYVFWPLGVGNCTLFCYVRFFEEKAINGVVRQYPPTVHISTQSQEGVLELLEALPFSLKELKERTVNADVKVDLGRVFAGSIYDECFENGGNVGYFRYVPTEATYTLPQSSLLTLRSASEDPTASYESILAAHPHSIPRYHPLSAAKRAVALRGENEQERIEGEFLDEGMREDVWTLYRGDKPILSLIPEVYPSEIMGFMNAHVLYCGDVGAEEVDFALKSLAVIYREKGYTVRTIPLADEDPFEGGKAMERIGMRADYRFVSLKKLLGTEK